MLPALAQLIAGYAALNMNRFIVMKAQAWTSCSGMRAWPAGRNLIA